MKKIVAVVPVFAAVMIFTGQFVARVPKLLILAIIAPQPLTVALLERTSAL